MSMQNGQGANWRIEYCDRIFDDPGLVHLTKWARLANPLYYAKIGLSHSYLRLVDDKGNVRQLIHGLALDKNINQLAPLGDDITMSDVWHGMALASVTGRFQTVTSAKSNVHIVAVAAEPGQSFMLDYVSRGVHDTKTLFEGSQADMEGRWKDGLSALAKFNKSTALYAPVGLFSPGQSCNAVTRLGMEAMGHEDGWVSSAFIRPGVRRRLSAEFNPSPSDHLSVDALNGQVMEDLSALLPEADSRFRRVEKDDRCKPVLFRDMAYLSI